MSESRTHAKALRVAKARGLEVIEPGPYELFIDIDSAEDLARYEAGMKVLGGSNGNEYLYLKEVRRSPSQSGTPFRMHIVVKTVAPLTQYKRIFLQALLGSDVKREYLGWLKVEEGNEHPTLFFERPVL